MSAQMLQLKQTIPPFKVNEGAEFDAVDLKDYIDNPGDHPLEFKVDTEESDLLPAGMVCAKNGVLSGAPIAGVAKELSYKVVIVVTCGDLTPLALDLEIAVYESIAAEGAEFTDLKNFWQAFANDLALPDIKTILEREISPADIYYLLGRYGTLIVWNADDLRPAEGGELISIEGVSERYNVYDFEVALVASPKGLYDSKRNLKDGYQTAEAMINEVYKRKWNIEMAGYDKLVNTAWIEVQRLNDLHADHKIEVYNYAPTQAAARTLEHVRQLMK
jgi:hypothetical protein